MNAMGETTSLLDLPLTHYLDVNAHAHSLSVLIKKLKLFIGQNGQLLTLDGRRRESFNLILIEAIEGIVFRPQGGCPDHVLTL